METRRFLYVVRFPAIALFACLLVAGAFAKRGFLDWAQMSQRNQELERSTASLQQERDRLGRRIDAFRGDSREQERVVRSTLGYTRPDEVVVELPEPGTEGTDGPDL